MNPFTEGRHLTDESYILETRPIEQKVPRKTTICKEKGYVSIQNENGTVVVMYADDEATLTHYAMTGEQLSRESVHPDDALDDGLRLSGFWNMED